MVMFHSKPLVYQRVMSTFGAQFSNQDLSPVSGNTSLTICGYSWPWQQITAGRSTMRNGHFAKLEVPTIYKAYFSGLCKGISPQNMALYGTNVPPF